MSEEREPMSEKRLEEIRDRKAEGYSTGSGGLFPSFPYAVNVACGDIRDLLTEVDRLRARLAEVDSECDTYATAFETHYDRAEAAERERGAEVLAHDRTRKELAHWRTLRSQSEKKRNNLRELAQGQRSKIRKLRIHGQAASLRATRFHAIWQEAEKRLRDAEAEVAELRQALSGRNVSCENCNAATRRAEEAERQVVMAHAGYGRVRRCSSGGQCRAALLPEACDICRRVLGEDQS